MAERHGVIPFEVVQIGDQTHLGAGHEGFDVHQDEHAFGVTLLTLPMPVMKQASTAEDISGRGLMARGPSSSTSDTESTTAPTTRPLTFSTMTTVKVLYSARVAAELHAQVDDGHDHAAQVDHALDERRARWHGWLLVGADLLHLQDVDAVLLAAQAEGEELAAGMAGLCVGARGSASCWATCGALRRSCHRETRCALAAARSGRRLDCGRCRPPRQPDRLLLQALGGGGGLFDQRGVLLRHLVELGDRRVHLADAVALLAGGGGDLADDVGDALHRADDLAHGLAGVVDQLGAGLDRSTLARSGP